MISNSSHLNFLSLVMDVFKACCLACLKEVPDLKSNLDLSYIFSNLIEENINFLHSLGQVQFCISCRTVLEGILEFKILCQISKTLIEDRLKSLQEKNVFGDESVTNVEGLLDSPKSELELNDDKEEADELLKDDPIDKYSELKVIESRVVASPVITTDDHSSAVKNLSPSSSKNEMKLIRTYTRTLSKSVIKGFPFICEHCGKHIIGRSDIKYHVIKQHLNGIRCPIKTCRAAFLTKVELSNHVASHEIKKKNFAQRSLTCSICNFTTTMGNRKNACEHLKPMKKLKLPKPTLCDLCGKVYKTTSQLGEHRRTVHINYVFGCSVCGAKFKSKNNLRTHISSVHGPRLECKHCGIKMAGPRSLTVHINSVHLNKRSCECKECGATFHATAALKKHLHIHYNTRPWNCDICKEQGYYSTDYLRKHYLRVHQLNYTLEEVKHHAIKVSHSYVS